MDNQTRNEIRKAIRPYFLVWSLTFLVLTGATVMLWYEEKQNTETLEQQAVDRSADNARSAYENCLRSNYNHSVNVAQDKILLHLDRAAQGKPIEPGRPVLPFAVVAAIEERRLDRRIKRSPPTLEELKKHYSKSPRSCNQLPSEPARNGEGDNG